MVVFTCNSCGESLRKNAVEKHLFRCKINEGLTCVDCMVLFREDYANHTSCITEAQRYGKTGVQHKEAKGQVMQETWGSNIQKYIDENSSIEAALKAVLSKLINTNIPRKEKGFMNLMKNLRPPVSAGLGKKAWLIAEVQPKPSSSNPGNAQSSESKPTVNPQEEKKDKKRKTSDEEIAVENSMPKKKKKTKEISKESKSPNAEINVKAVENSMSKKKRKAKEMSKENTSPNAEINVKAVKNGLKKRSRKRKSKALENEENTQHQSAVVEEPVKSKKNKKNKTDVTLTEVSNNLKTEQNTEGGIPSESLSNGTQVKMDKTSNFKWKNALRNTLKKTLKNSKKKRMKLRILKKLVIPQYLSANGLEDSEVELDKAKKLFEVNINNGKFLVERKFISLKN